MICAQAIVQFRPHESYEKYLKLLVGVMVLIQLFLPIGSLIAGVDRMNVTLQLDSFRESLEQGMEEARQQAQEADALLEQMTLEEVRRRMEEQAVPGEVQDEPEAVEGASVIPGNTGSADMAGGPIIVEVEPVEPILGE